MRCVSCGSSNPAGFRYCGACGRPLVQRPAETRAERKIVTALFCDVVGFTARSERLDPEDVHRLLEPYYARARAELEHFGGTVEKFIGDAVFALFGAPRAHEDDPYRGVRAALAVRDAIAELNESEPALDLHVRIGITTGEAFVELGARPLAGEGMAWGDVLNTSSRLQAAAPADGILVDEPTQRATARTIEYEPVEPIAVKGKEELLTAWSAVATRARPGVELADHEQIPLADRVEELETLVGALSAAMDERAVRAVTLIGEPGIGKSRLVLELFLSVRKATDFISWRQGRSLPYGGGVSFWALGEMVKNHAGVLESDPVEMAAEKLRQALEELFEDPRELERVERSLRPLVGLAAEEARGGRDAAFASWRRFFVALAERRPLVLVFDDLHWADDGLLDFVEELVQRAGRVPLLVVCTARPELVERRPDWLAESERTTILGLAALSREATVELVTALSEPLPAPLTRRVAEASDGNPLYAVEYARMLASRGDVGAESMDLPAPGSLQALLAARIDALPPDEKAALQHAAVIGKVFWTGALAAAGRLPRRSVERNLRALERKDFVRRSRRSTFADEPEYAFSHILLSETAYRQIPRRRRAEAHLRAAEWIESLGSDRALDRADLLAHHYCHALELAGAAGEETAGLAARAQAALAAAAAKATSLHAYNAAAAHYRAALQLLPPEAPERSRLLFGLAEARFYGESAGEDVLVEARDHLLVTGDAGRAAEAGSLLGWLAYHRGDRESAFRHVEEAVGLVAELEPSKSQGEVLSDLAGFLAHAGENAQAIAVATRVLEIADALDAHELRANGLASRGIARFYLGDLAGRADLEESIRLAEELDSPLVALGYGNLADLHGALGELGRAFELQAIARRSAERFGHAAFGRWLDVERVCELYWTARWDEARGLADSLVQHFDEGEAHYLEGLCRQMRGRIRLARGDLAGAAEDADRSVAFARAIEEPQSVFPALTFRARCSIEAGASAQASELVDEVLELWQARRSALPPASWVADLAALLRLLGREPELCPDGAGTRTRWLDAAEALCRGHPEEAAALYARIGAVPLEAEVRVWAARSLLERGEQTEARGHLGRAREIYRQARAGPALAAAERLAADARS
jgi:class 3 adenylate cyclase/tetratricopeptide (TPR) repeat protein